MRVTHVVLALAVSAAPPAVAQAQRIGLDFSVGGGSDAGRGALSAWRQVLRAPLAARISVGVRTTFYVSMGSSYRNRETVQGALTPTLNIDPGVFGANIAVAGEVPVGPIALGANLDLLGVATGARWTQGSLEGKPETWSYFQYSTADHGSLNSEFYLAVRVSSRIELRGGASHYVTDYIVTDESATGQPQARYQRFETVPFAALRIRL